MLKARDPLRGELSLWMRNIQMALASVPIALVSAFIEGKDIVRRHGLLYGFDSAVWLTVLWYSIGGILVAICIKYTDSIQKNFCVAVSILLSTILSIYAFDFHPTVLFLIGASAVIGSVILYAKSGLSAGGGPGINTVENTARI